MIIIQGNKLTWPARLILRYSPRLYDILSHKPWFVAISRLPNYSHVSKEDVEQMDYTLAETILPLLAKFMEESKKDPYWSDRQYTLQIIYTGFEMLAGNVEYDQELVAEALELFAVYYEEFYL